jgi:hypothetical protein
MIAITKTLIIKPIIDTIEVINTTGEGMRIIYLGIYLGSSIPLES